MLFAVIIIGIIVIMAVMYNNRERYTFYPGVDSKSNDIILVADLKDNIAALKDKCNNTPRCVAFNTNGWLKHNVSAQPSWVQWTTDPNKGMYVRNK